MMHPIRLSILRSEAVAIERQEIIWTLVETRGDVRAAARLLGAGERTLWRKVKVYGIDVPAIRRMGAAAYPESVHRS